MAVALPPKNNDGGLLKVLLSLWFIVFWWGFVRTPIIFDFFAVIFWEFSECLSHLCSSTVCGMRKYRLV